MKRIIIISFLFITLGVSAQMNSWFFVQSPEAGGGIITCNALTSYGDGPSYPTETTVTLGSETGTVFLYFQGWIVPDKCIVIFDGDTVIDTGYRGDENQQTNLNNALDAIGAPHETIINGGYFKEAFAKTTATTTAIVRVYAPMGGTKWEFTLYCPQ